MRVSNGTQGIGQVEGGVNNGEGLGLYGGTSTRIILAYKLCKN